MKFPDKATVETARSGDRTVRAGGRYLYSRYDPRRETDRFVAARIRSFRDSTGQEPSCVVVISEGLGYLEEACGRHLTDCDIISVHLTSSFSPAAADASKRTLSVQMDAGASPDETEMTLDEQRFETLIAETDISRILVIEWQPSTSTFATEYGIARGAIERVLRRRAADSATVRRWGRLWIRNILRNCERSPMVSRLPFFGARPSLVVCPGPSAGRTLKALSEAGDGPVVIAVSSALELLYSYGILPDVVVHSDAGYYATLHFREAWKSLLHRKQPSALIMPLTAAPPPVPTGEHPPTATIVSGNSPIEQTVLKAIGLDSATVPEAGTVTATALRIAGMIGTGPRFVTGLDLCLDDVRHHASPHAFDTFLSVTSDRCNSELTSRLNRTIDTRRSTDCRTRRAANLDVYAEWFRSRGNEFSFVGRIDPTEVDTGMVSATVSGLLTAVHKTSSGSSSREVADGRTSSDLRGHTDVPGDSNFQGEALISKPGTVVTSLADASLAGEPGANPLRRELARWLAVEDDIRSIHDTLRSIRDHTGADAELS